MKTHIYIFRAQEKVGAQWNWYTVEANTKKEAIKKAPKILYWIRNIDKASFRLLCTNK